MPNPRTYDRVASVFYDGKTRVLVYYRDVKKRAGRAKKRGRGVAKTVRKKVRGRWKTTQEWVKRRGKWRRTR